ncbi:MAG: VWA domain-containing protein [Acidobacteriaceae bacterium]
MIRSVLRFGLVSSLLLLMGSSVFAQGPKTTTTPAGQTTIRTEAHIVVLDVMVTDKQGVPVHGLTAADFVIRENGGPQTIKSMDEHTGIIGASQLQAPNVHTNRPAPGADVWNVVLYDQFNTPQADQQRARAELVRFANALAPKGNVALVSFGGGLRVVSPFSAGQPGMVKTLAAGALQFHHGPLLQPYNADEQFDLEQYLSKLPAAAATAVRNNHRETEMGALEVRVKDTLGAFSAIAQWLQHYPGKKNVFWLSAGFPITAEPQQFRGQDGVSGSAVFREDYFGLQQRVNQQLATARIAIFPLDVRGNMGAGNEGIDTADVKGAQYAEPGGGQLLNDDQGQAHDRIGQGYVEMNDVAKATGGIARYNRNDLADVLAEQFRQGQSFYSMSYTPSDDHYDGKYRKIELTSANKSYRLSYRRGYYALKDTGVQPNAIDAFTLALKLDAPPATGLIFSSRFIRHSGDGHAADEKASLVYTIDVSGLVFTPAAGGVESAGVDCAVVEYDASGRLLGTSQIHVDGHVRPGQLERVKAAGLTATQDFALAPGAAALAVGVRDHTTGNFGAVHFNLAQ